MSDWIIVYEKNKKHHVTEAPKNFRDASEAKKYAWGFLQRMNDMDKDFRTLVDIVYMNADSAKFDGFADSLEELYE